jgi:glycosyltransferase involved in cell wall biosynthesis
MKRLRVLMSAYACEPGCGSEPGIGWNSVAQAARVCELWVLTRTNNRDVIERHTSHAPLAGVNWVYVDLPPWMRWWKKGPRGALLYYSLWQIASYRAARRLHSSVNFDRIHHVTMGTYWLPTYLVRLPAPLIWGPVGGGETAPRSFYRSFSLRGRCHEYLRDAVRWLSRFRPAVRAASRRSRIVLATTDETAAQLRRIGASNPHVLSHTALPRGEFERLSRLPSRTEPPFRVISIGRLIHWKGYHLALEAFALLKREVPDGEYWLVGDGPERKRLENLAKKLDIEESVRFRGTLPRDQVLDTLAASDVLVHPSLHDSGGYACVEAMAAGRPVICLDLGGPRVLVTSATGIKVHPGQPEQAVDDLAEAMLSLARDRHRCTQLGLAARSRVRDHLLWDAKGALFERLYTLADGLNAVVPERL